MTPIAKNVIVADEQGNVYEPTYPKRAKGLVKSGRARFVGENKICLMCPPQKFEEANMDTAKTNPTTPLTAKEVYEQITLLQRELTENVHNPMVGLTEAANDIVANERENEICFDVVSVLYEAFAKREETLRQILAFYIRVYDELTASERKTN